MKDIVIKSLVTATKLTKKEIENLIETPPSSDLGDFAFPCFVLSKKLKKNPAEIASDLSKKIKSKSFESVVSQGPYINFFLSRSELARSVISEIKKVGDKYGSSSLGSKKKTVIEFPSPNTNKPLHIGHLRNLVLGQSISEILKFNGEKVNIINLNNDRGVHICKSMIAYDKFGKSDSPEKSKKKSDHFVGDYYVKFAKEAKKNPKLEEEAQACLQKWESGDKATLALWKKMNSWALDGFKETYKKMDYTPDKEYFESKIYNSGKSIILDGLKSKKLEKKEDGAIFIDLKKEGLGEKILLRGDGTSIYMTQDIYLSVLKQKDFKFNKSLYISAREQEYHFKTLFTVLKKLGYSWAKNLNHISYGMVNLESGRMKSREGNVVDLDDLISEMINLAKEGLDKRNPDLSEKEKDKRANQISMAAIRYFFLKVEKNKDMVFKPEESIDFEGNTGPYLLYSYARAQSILDKAKYKDSKKFTSKEISDIEKSIILELSKFPEIIEQAYKSYAPNLIANYAFSIAQKFNEFYHNSKVLGSEQESFRLSLVSAFSQVLKNALNLLGISVLEKM